jgi:hypothetical protein
MGKTFSVARLDVDGPQGDLHFVAGEATGHVGAGFGGEVNAFHISGELVPTWYSDNGTPILGGGGGFDIKILGAEANAGVVDGSLKLGAEAYGAKAERQGSVRIGHVEVTYATELCEECIGISGSAGKEWSGFFALGAGGGFKLKFDYVPDEY